MWRSLSTFRPTPNARCTLSATAHRPQLLRTEHRIHVNRSPATWSKSCAAIHNSSSRHQMHPQDEQLKKTEAQSPSGSQFPQSSSVSSSPQQTPPKPRSPAQFSQDHHDPTRSKDMSAEQKDALSASALGLTTQKLFTPCLVVDEERLVSNIRWMQKKAADKGVKLRPHIKTHKSLKIAEMQMKEGAVGITASKVSEAVTFLQNGFTNVTLAYPVVQVEKARYLLQQAIEVINARKNSGNEEEVQLHVVVDHIKGVHAYRQAVEETNYPGKLQVMVEIDTGLHRCGITEEDYEFEQTPMEGLEVPIPSSADAELREQVLHGSLHGRFHVLLEQLLLPQRPMPAKSRHPKLQFAGLLSYGGHAYSGHNREEVSDMAKDETEVMSRLRQRIMYDYALPEEVVECSVGSTPMELVRDSYHGLTELRPGNYVFMDMNCLVKGLAPPSSLAMVMFATVISDSPRYWIIDAGSKELSSDIGCMDSLSNMGYGVCLPASKYKELLSSNECLKLNEKDDKSAEPQASEVTPTLPLKTSVSIPRTTLPGTNWHLDHLVVTKLSEEHGWIEKTSENKGSLNIGDMVAIIPNHACSVIALADNFYLQHPNGHVSAVSIDARGKSF